MRSKVKGFRTPLAHLTLLVGTLTMLQFVGAGAAQAQWEMLDTNDGTETSPRHKTGSAAVNGKLYEYKRN